MAERDNAELLIENKKDPTELEREISNDPKHDRKKMKIVSCQVAQSQSFQNTLNKIEEVEIINSDILNLAIRELASTTLKRLTIRECKIKEDDVAALQMKELLILNLYGNNIKDLSKMNFSQLPKLEVLNLGWYLF